MVIVVPSVMHTGTRLVCTEILKKFKQVYPDSHLMPPTFDFYVRDHTTDAGMENLEWWAEQYPCMIPLRHPVRVLKSHIDRNRPMEDDRGVGLWAQWANLEKFMNDPRHDCNVIPVDHPNRNDYLAKANDNLGTRFKTQWPIHSRVADLHNWDAEITQELQEQIPESVMKFYHRALRY